jgi:predicted amidohydrolase YtcJ
MLIAKPNAMILYATLAKGPKLPLEQQVNSTRQFMRELNRLALPARLMPGVVSRTIRKIMKLLNSCMRNSR